MTVTNYVSKGIVVTFTGLTGQLIDIDTGGDTADIVDVTHQESANEWKEFKSAFKEGGDVTLLLHFDPDATAPAPGATGTLVIAWPSGSTKKFSASAIVKKVAEVKASLGAKISHGITFKITGAPNWSYTPA